MIPTFQKVMVIKGKAKEEMEVRAVRARATQTEERGVREAREAREDAAPPSRAMVVGLAVVTTIFAALHYEYIR